jgi:hypothetical protein
MKFTLAIDCDNAAFGETLDGHLEETARLLRGLARRLEAGEDYGTLRDVNGNTVGRFELEGDRPARRPSADEVIGRAAAAQIKRETWGS